MTTKFEIKNRYTGGIIFSLETESFKLCIKAAVKASADLRYADLSYTDLRSANLRSADLRYADLSYTNLRSADLRSANLSSADLRYTEGVNKHLVTPLRILLEQPGPIWAYKLVNASGEGPFNGGINYLDPKVEGFAVNNLDTDEDNQCGAGVNLATLDWCMKEWKEGYRILIMEFFANQPKPGNLVVPTATDGKFRCAVARRVGEVDLREIGLVKTEKEKAA